MADGAGVFAFRLLEVVVVFALLVAMYWSPTSIAFGRRAQHRVAIAMLNTLTGWTIIGWLAAFVWSLVANPEPEPDIAPVVVTVSSRPGVFQAVLTQLARLSSARLAGG